MGVQILYDYQHGGYSDILSSIAERISRKNKIDISIDSVSSNEILSKLIINPNYTFVIIHIGSEIRDAFQQVSECRRFTESIIVAESKAFLKCSTNVSECFDEFIYACSEHSMLQLLEKYGFIKKDITK